MSLWSGSESPGYLILSSDTPDRSKSFLVKSLAGLEKGALIFEMEESHWNGKVSLSSEFIYPDL